MNLVDCVVTEVLSAPMEKYNRWWVKVEYDGWGSTSTSEIMCNSFEDAMKVDVGHKFLA
ncbi:MAG: hypothetical protein ACXW1D_00085 [Halobacteriota archaeon]